MFNFVGRKILVTGAGRGIGRGIAEKISECGGTVYALSRSMKPLDSLVSSHERIIPIQANIENWDEIREKLSNLETLDGLVNNAYTAAAYTRSVLEWNRMDLVSAVKGNMFGAINVSQIVGKKMVEAKRGSIVNISSVVSLQAYPGDFPYCMTKAGLDMITKQFALELGPYNIRVNSVNPTMVMTDITREAIDKGFTTVEAIASKIPLKRVATVDDVVDPVLFLLSDGSQMVSGTINIVDGGMASSFGA